MIHHLRCEYLAEPLGVDTREPRFSWQLSKGRQSAYQMVVERDGVTLWDTGKVVSPQSVNVAYQPGWNAVGFDDASWLPAARGEQSLELSAALFEPDRKVETLRPVGIEPRDGAWRIDFGRNFTGWFEIRLRGGRKGEVVKIQTANRTEETLEYDQESEYIFDATGEGTFCHRFNWMAGRWVTLVGLPTAPRLEDVAGYVVTNDRKRTGTFECSDPLLNAIYETDVRTYIANTVNGAVMDCPHRERYGYGEVALACTWGCGLPNYESAAFYTKAARDWRDVQSEDGMVNTIAPQPYLGAGGKGVHGYRQFGVADPAEVRGRGPGPARTAPPLSDSDDVSGVWILSGTRGDGLAGVLGGGRHREPDAHLLHEHCRVFHQGDRRHPAQSGWAHHPAVLSGGVGVRPCDVGVVVWDDPVQLETGRGRGACRSRRSAEHHGEGVPAGPNRRGARRETCSSVLRGGI